MRVFYFGCWGRELGHFLRDPQGRSQIALMEDELPWKHEIDARLCPDYNGPHGGGPQHQGIVKHHQKDGWTAIAFWDRSVDKRHGSNSAFIADALLTYDEMIELAKQHFPQVLERFKFELALEGEWADETQFTCPKCGSHQFGSSRLADDTWERICHGSCHPVFTWHQRDDAQYMKPTGRKQRTRLTGVQVIP